jgi:hypothetical protein
LFQPELTSEGEQTRFFLRERERWRDRLYLVLDESFVPKQVDVLSWPLPEALFPVYYGYRPLRLVYKFVVGPVWKRFTAKTAILKVVR